MKNYLILLITFATIFASCIKDDFIQDFVQPTLRITTIPDTILVNSTYQFEFMYLNNIGVEEVVEGQWSSSNPEIIEIDNNGLATAKAIGSATIKIESENGGTQLESSFDVNVGTATVVSAAEKSGSIQTTSSYALGGDFTLKEDGDNLILEFFEDYNASTALPGLYIYLTNNRNSTANALEIGAVETFNGAHSYIIEDTDINDFQFVLYFCKPFVVKVGDGQIN